MDRDRPHQPGAVKRAQGLSEGLPVASFSPARKPADKEIEAARPPPRPQRLPGISPRAAARRRRRRDRAADSRLLAADRKAWQCRYRRAVALCLSAAPRQRSGAGIAARAGAVPLHRSRDSRPRSWRLSTPQKIGALRQEKNFVGLALLGLLVACDILFKVDAKDEGLRASEGDDHLVLWDFHDLLFHTHSTEGRQANPLGGRYPYVGSDRRRRRPCARHGRARRSTCRRLRLRTGEPASPFAALLRRTAFGPRFRRGQADHACRACAPPRHRRPACKSKWTHPARFRRRPCRPRCSTYTSRPYPSAGSAYELELYLTVNNCEGLARGFYHYDADRHALVPIAARAQDIEAQFSRRALRWMRWDAANPASRSPRASTASPGNTARSPIR